MGLVTFSLEKSLTRFVGYAGPRSIFYSLLVTLIKSFF